MGAGALGSDLAEPAPPGEGLSDPGQSSVARTATEYVGALDALLRAVDLEALESVVARLCEVRARGMTVYVAGNGGSAATASHWVNDLAKATKRPGLPAMRALSLSDNVSWLTALANDEGYERGFAGQLENFARQGDLLVVISASGNSSNLVQAVELGRAMGVLTVGLLGFAGGRLKDLVDAYVWVETADGEYGLVESAHSVICDILTACVIAHGERA